MGSARDVETRKMRKFSMKFRGNMGENDMPELRSQIMPVSEETFTQMRLADEVSKRSLVSLNIVCSTRAARSESSNSKSSSNLSEDQSTCGLSEVQDDMNTPQPTYRSQCFSSLLLYSSLGKKSQSPKAEIFEKTP